MLPRGGAAIYSGLGLSSFSAPLVASWVGDDPNLLPCPQLLQAESHCAPYATIGQGRVDLRYGLRRKGPGPLATVGIAAHLDRWNFQRRGQYNAVGTGRNQIEALLVTGGEVPAGDWTQGALLLGAYGWRPAPTCCNGWGACPWMPHGCATASAAARTAGMCSPGGGGGASDPTDLSLGWHRTFKPRGARSDRAQSR